MSNRISIYFLLKMYLVENMTDIGGLCCALNYNKELTVDSCIYHLFLIAYTF